MTRFNIIALAVAGIMSTTASAPASAQYHHVGSRHHSIHSQHVFRDRHGHIIGGVPQHALEQNSSCVLPYSGRAGGGSFYARNGHYYYSPRTAGLHTTNFRPQEISFGAFSHVDELAVRLEDMANQLCLDLYYNYSHNPEFRETYSEAYQVLEVARFIHDSEHRHDRASIRQQLLGLDDLFHHIEDDIRGWSRHHRRQIGDLGILSKTALLESTLHHLMNDVGVGLTPDVNEEAPRPDDHDEELAPSPLELPTAFRQ